MYTTYVQYSKKKKKLRPCAARNLALTVLKPGATIPISNIHRPIAIAVALKKYINSYFRKARSSCAEWIASYFDSQPIIFASFFEFRTSEHLAETPVVTGVTARLHTSQYSRRSYTSPTATGTVHPSTKGYASSRIAT